MIGTSQKKRYVHLYKFDFRLERSKLRQLYDNAYKPMYNASKDGCSESATHTGDKGKNP